MKRILLIEPDTGGHHDTYLREIALKFKQMQFEVVIFSQLIPLFAAEFNINTVKIKYWRLRRLRSGFLKYIEMVLNFFCSIWNLREIYHKTKLYRNTDSVLFYCYLDGYMNEFLSSTLFDHYNPVSWTGILMRLPQPQDKKSFRYTILQSGHCLGVAVLTKSENSLLKPFCRQIIHFPDFADGSIPNIHFDITKKIKQLSDGRKIISLLGEISVRKGIYTFVRTVVLLPETEYFFVIAGTASPALTDADLLFVKNQFCNRANCFYHDTRIPSEADFNQLVAMSDIVYAAYKNFNQSSNILAKAALFKRPVIVSRDSYMEQQVVLYDMGVAIDADSPENCAAAIQNMQSHYLTVRDYLELNSIEALPDVLLELISAKR